MARKKEAPDRRPVVVTIAGWVAAITLPLSLLALLGRATSAVEARFAEYLASESGLEVGSSLTLNWILLGVMVLTVVLAVVGVIGLLRMKRWAWVFLSLLMALGLMFNLARVWIGYPQYTLMLVYAINALLLNQPEVRRAFRIGEKVDEAAL